MHWFFIILALIAICGFLHPIMQRSEQDRKIQAYKSLVPIARDYQRRIDALPRTKTVSRRVGATITDFEAMVQGKKSYDVTVADELLEICKAHVNVPVSRGDVV